ncbi:MAG TPA: chemotaxis protein CheR, partial [Alcanivorax sp.]|nr:chemotaxis protein CheR [Alcanivorax sp.]
EMTDRVLRDRQFFVTLLNDLTVNVTEMFRDPEFYKAFREEVVPVLKTFPFIKIWHAGCSTGEEIYSMAILLEEEGLYERAMLYATDID